MASRLSAPLAGTPLGKREEQGSLSALTSLLRIPTTILGFSAAPDTLEEVHRVPPRLGDPALSGSFLTSQPRERPCLRGTSGAWMDVVSSAPARRIRHQPLAHAPRVHAPLAHPPLAHAPLAHAPSRRAPLRPATSGGTSARPPQRLPGAPLRIAMLAPPWISVPAPGYGGVESVVSTLTEALVRRGHDVTLFCAPGSVSQADVVTLLDKIPPRRDRALAV